MWQEHERMRHVDAEGRDLERMEMVQMEVDQGAARGSVEKKVQMLFSVT